VILSTPSLAAQELTIRTLEIVKEIVTRENTAKSLNPPDVGRLRANIRRLTHAESQPAGVLRELLQIEFKSLSHNARSSPCTAALNEVLTKTSQQSTVLVISNQNHDAEALAFNLQTLMMKGNAVISV
jgi:Lhr-like helicase